MNNGCFFLLFWLHVYRDRVGGEGEFLENTISISLPKGLPLGFGEICVDFWDFRRGVPETTFLLLLVDEWRSVVYIVVILIPGC